MKLLAEINLDNISAEEAATYTLREAARAVVFDNDGHIAVLHATKVNHHKLPGGGLEQGESLPEALKRECLEEIGCEIEIGKELGAVIEIRKLSKEKQISHCFTAKVIGQKGQPDFTREEKAAGFVIKWLPLDEAIEIIKNDHSSDWEGEYILARDLIFLKAVET